jgi:hypothetical protein
VIAATGGAGGGTSPFAPTPASFPGPEDVGALGKNMLFASGPGGSTDPALLADIAYVDSMYRTLTGGPADNNSLITWVTALHNGAARSQVVQAVWGSNQHRELETQALYQNYLHRSATAAELSAWDGAFAAGTSELSAAVMILTSQEFTAANPSNPQFVAALFQDALGRAASSSELAFWANTVAANGRANVAQQILTSDEASTRMLNVVFANYLGRSLGSADQQYWLGQLHSGQTPAQVVQTILESDELFNRAAGAAGV